MLSLFINFMYSCQKMDKKNENKKWNFTKFLIEKRETVETIFAKHLEKKS